MRERVQRDYQEEKYVFAEVAVEKQYQQDLQKTKENATVLEQFGSDNEDDLVEQLEQLQKQRD